MIQENYPILLDGDTEVADEAAMLMCEGGARMEKDSVGYLILHCSATRVTQGYTPQQMERNHRARGFRTFGDHFYIRKSDVTTQHRDLLEVDVHCHPWNRCSIGICYEGGLDAEGRPADTRTLEQTAQIESLLKRLHQRFHRAKIRGHRDMPNTVSKSCLCLDAGQFFGYIKQI